MAVICVFGASTTWGAWDYEGGCWVNRLRLFFDSNNYDVDIYNLGVSGDNTEDLLGRFEVECKARLPTIIIFSIGDNDSTQGSPKYIPVEKFGENIEKLTKVSREFTPNILFLGTKGVDEEKTNPVPWDKSVSYNNDFLKKYDDELKKISEKNKLSYLKMFDLLDKDDFEDGLHPNSKGHEKIFLEVKKYLFENKFIDLK